MSNQLSDWEKIEEKYSAIIYSITWEHVALSLRRSLLYPEETLAWKAWAYAYLGAVEQTLLGYPRRDNHKLLFHISSSLDRLNILEEALDYGK